MEAQMMSRPTRTAVALIAAAAFVLAGCSATYVGGHDCDETYVRIWNDTDETQYIYIDGWYVGSLEPDESGVYEVYCGWHYIEAYDEFGVFVDGFSVEAYSDCGYVFYWHLFLLLAPAEEEPARVAPAAVEAGEDDCPEDDAPAPVMGPEPVAEVF
jgi:predicted small secreted protein